MDTVLVTNVGNRTRRVCGHDLMAGRSAPVTLKQAQNPKVQRLVDAGVLVLGTPPTRPRYAGSEDRLPKTAAPVKVEGPPVTPPPVEQPEEETAEEMVAALDPEQLEQLTKKDLRKLCEEHGMATDGNKSELIARLANPGE